MRKWIIALAIMLAAPAVGAAATIYVAAPTPEQVVEGHTVFTVIQAANVTRTNETKFAAAVAVLVREYSASETVFRFPGVLWFNDQYLVDPSTDVQCNNGADASNGCATFRYPCNGAVLMVNQGDADPRPASLGGNDAALVAFTAPNYVESYFVTDPNDNSWTIDKGVVAGETIWGVGILNNQANMGLEDDGSSNCAPYTDSPCGGVDVLPVVDATGEDPVYNDTGTGEGRFTHTPLCAPGTGGSRDYPTTGGNAIQYNAVLFAFLDDLTQRGTPKDHNAGSADRAADVSGCDPNTSEWPCPSGDDNLEGNSHDYNPASPYPVTTYDGKGNHGGSAACPDGNPHASPDGSYQGYQCHATANVDLYYGFATPHDPLTRNFVVNDVEGSTAPYYCEDSVSPCNNNDIAPGPYTG